MYISPDDKSKIVADAIGVSHFIVANICVILGSLSDVFKGLLPSGSERHGLDFVYLYFDRPAFLIFKGLTEAVEDNDIFAFLTGELIILVSSVFYGLITYFLMRFFYSMRE